MEKKGEKNFKEIKSTGKFHLIIINFVRAILVLAFVGALMNERYLVLFVSVLALFITFIPILLENNFGFKVPAEFEIMIMLFIYGILFFGEVRGFYSEFWWWDILLNSVASVALGLVGMTILIALYSEERVEASLFVIVIFAFCFSVAAGTLWEVFEFGADQLFGFNLQGRNLADTMEDIIVNVFWAFVVSTSGYFYVKKGKIGFISGFMLKLIKKNPKIFGYKEDNSEKLIRIIKEGESDKLEFKSTLRKNLHTGLLDKKLELATLKTMVAYLNSKGGTLLVGVDNSGDIIGLNKDEFENKDKLGLHFTNMIKWHIGNEYLPFIDFDILEIDGKNILRVECIESDKPVFLKGEGEEEFYIRNGPSSAKLNGSSLIDYVGRKFKKD